MEAADADKERRTKARDAARHERTRPGGHTRANAAPSKDEDDVT